MKFPGTQAFVNQLVVYVLVTLAGGGSVGLGAVWMRQQITLTAAANKTLEGEVANLRRQLDVLNVQVEQERTDSVLERRNLEWHLGLEQAPRNQVTRVPGDARLLLAAKRELPLELLPAAALARFSRPEDR
jgi:hypothetical protein